MTDFVINSEPDDFVITPTADELIVVQQSDPVTTPETALDIAEQDDIVLDDSDEEITITQETDIITVVPEDISIVPSDGPITVVTEIGLPGPAGQPGADGPPGPPGPEGADGAPGVAGPTGPPGAIGPEGPTGASGPPGADGADGAVGPEGPEGPAGPQGPQGEQGPIGPGGGDQGPPGPEGPMGPAGATGPAGPQGDPGPIGPTGADGATGPPGADGTDGVDGATGPAGPQGNPGPTGATGATGPQGIPGTTGATGAAGPKGDKGDTGATGSQGPQGNPGATGAQGPQGNPGTPGATGAQGIQGVQGPIGPTGPAGADGSDAFVPDLVASRLLGRGSASGTGQPEPITVGVSLGISGTALRRSALTGDVTAPVDSNATTIANNAVSNVKAADVPTQTIKGRATAATGDPEDLTPTQVRAIINVADGANNYVHPNHSGDITSVSDGNTTIAANAVSNTKLADMAADTLKGRLTSIGDPQDLTATQVRTLLNIVNYVHPNHSGDVVSVADGNTTIAADVVSNTKLANVPTQTIKGRTTTGTGDPEDLTATQVRTLLNVADGANAYVHPNHSGDVTSAGEGATTIVANAVTNAKAADMPADTMKGRALGAGAGDPTDLTVAQVRALLAIVDGSSYVHPNHFGDVTSVGDGAQTIALNAVSNTKLADMAADTIKGRLTSLGDPQDLTPAQVRGLLNVADGANNYIHPNHFGDVTSTGDGATVIGTDKVTNTHLANMATQTIKGRTSAGTNDPEDLTASQVRMVIAKGLSTNSNLVTNGGFEDGLTGWTATSVVLMNDANGISGEYYAQIPINTNVLYNEFIPVIEGEVLNISVLAKGDVADATHLRISMFPYDIGHITVPGTANMDNAFTTAWTKIERTWTVPAGGRVARIRVQHLAGSLSSVVNVDEISITRTTYVHPNHSGDVVSVGDGAQTIQANVVTNAKLAQMPTLRIKGNATAGTADPVDLTATQVRTILNVADGANNYVHPNHTGDVTSTGDGATAIGVDKVTNVHLANMVTARFKGRATAGTGDPEDMTVAQAKTLLAYTAADFADIASGTYVPILTDIANVTSSTASSFFWLRIGSYVMVTGRIQAQPTLVNTTTEIQIELPIASALTAANQMAGLANADGGRIEANATTDKASWKWTQNVGISNTIYALHFAYRLL